MNEVAFVERREADWRRFTILCDKADVSPSYLGPKEFHEFVRLYRRVSGDLATARTRSNNLQLIEFLNDLVGRGYGILYRAPRKPFFQAVLEAIRIAARTVRECAWYVGASVATFVFGIVVAWVLVDRVPSTHDHFVPPGWQEVFKQWKTGTHDEATASQSAGMTGFYIINNPLVAARSGAIAAATFGVVTAQQLFQNGAILGTLAHEVSTVGKLGFLVTSVSPHGVPEVSGLIIASAAGYVMGWALINPGRRKRGEALREAGKKAIVLLTTGVILMFIAAPIEGFFSFNPNVPDAVKIGVAAAELIFWGVFWTGFGKATQPEPELSRPVT
jgi:uncharacterized membrane protein SpoIIM required for sporulation